MPFEPWQLAMIDDAGYNDIREEHIEEVAQEILYMGISNVSRDNFELACSRCGIDPENFTQADLEELEILLNEKR
jgi:hypothetical protein